MNTDPSPARRLLLVPDHGQIQRLLAADICNPAGRLRLREDLNLADLAGSVFLANARLFLSLIGDSGIPATAKGNLSRAFVLDMAERMRFSEYDGEWRPYIKVRQEDDVWPLHLLRVVLTVGGVIRKYRKRFLITRRGAGLAVDERAGALQAYLLRMFFGRFDLGYMDRLRDDVVLQHTVTYSLWMMRRIGGDWVSPERLRELAQLGLHFMDETDDERRNDRQWLFEHRILRPLENFGLLETRLVTASASAVGRRFEPYEVRKTVLYDLSVAFDLGGA